MDARYNVVQWENRNERGWSVGGSLGDPRTGEILKGMARMDSHRARTDYNIYAALMGADAAAADTAFVLARVRQVSAHEVGHTLGLAHNYIASTYERGSVMDYPPPRVRLDADGDDRHLAGVRRRARARTTCGRSAGATASSRAATERDSLARDRRRRAAEGLPLSLRRRRAPGVRVRPAHESVGRRRDAAGVPPARRRPCAAWRCRRFGAAQHPRRRAGRAAAGAVRARSTSCIASRSTA